EVEIVNYYDNCQIDYEIVWHLNTHMCMHYGYWDSNTKNLRAALNNMNVQVAKLVNPMPDMHVLDAGCGVGGSSVFLAKNFGCKTTGITLSDKQVQTCFSNAIKCGVAHLSHFEKQNYLNTHFADNTFDVVWAIESVCYAFDKADFIKEAYRILKPGGKLVVADFFNYKVQPNTRQHLLMQKWTSTWAIKQYADVDEFYKKLSNCGFVNCTQKDVTAQVIKSIKRLYYSFFPGLPITYISQWLGFRNRTQTANTWSTYYQYKAYKQNLWRYMFYTGTKPKNN
ncbi:MAG TPA: methyltransferase domain-containing protein, partial [Bacteroidia bacterium]|nr:methyltransferase domain-containing protein [Bacteroidia bacterium]